LPATVSGAIPLVLALVFEVDPGFGLPLPLAAAVIGAGVAALIAGGRLAAETIGLFSTEGEGTLAPWDPTRRLVISGPYRRTRNPMITGVALILLGEGLVLGSVAILTELAVFAAVNGLYMPLVEEPGLRRRFGAEYEAYARAVPRWIPRRTPWHGE
jgi:protein-S-isoprenylcysteine O-methyltransferase Ste14